MEMGNFGFPNHNITSSEDSDSDTEDSHGEDSKSDVSPEDSDSDMSSLCNENSDTSSDNEINATFDSAIQVQKKKYHSCYDIVVEDVNDIETALDFDELISCIFLLFDDTNYAIQVIRSLIAAGPENFSRGKLSEWVRSSPKNWKFKLFEALAIIQNNNILIKFGVCKEDINVMHNAPVHINRFKKVLFSYVCDRFTREQAEELINNVRFDAKFEHDISLGCDPKHIEFHILFWISQDYIKIDREPYLRNLTKHLKDPNFAQIFDRINEISSRASNTLKRKTDESKFEHLDEEEECYEIKDLNNPGLVVIINNDNFAKNVEKREEYKYRRPTYPLADRPGSSKDVQKMEEIFKSLNYEVIARHNIVHDQLVDEIYKTVRNNFKVGHHSVLVLCVLSHGDEGVVYGANSIPLKKEKIVNSVSGSSHLINLLAGIPKIIIIQACQGKRVLYVEPEPDLLVPDGAEPDTSNVADGNDTKTDALESYDPRDKVVCMPTIKGFVALRNEVKGTPYIQELCRCIKKYHAKKHFIDIMTIVHRNLTSERCIVKQVNEKRPVCMIPEFISSLSKPLYLTQKQSISRC